MKKIVFIIAFILIYSNLKADIGVFNNVINTNAVTNIQGTSVTCGGTITLLTGDPQVTEKGVVRSTSINPTTSNFKIIVPGNVGPGPISSATYSAAITGLSQSTMYHARAYMINSDGTFYGQDVSFATIPTLGEWGLFVLAGLFIGVGSLCVWKQII